MITKCRTAIIFGALAAFILCGTVQAWTIGQGDFFTLHFDENGNGLIDLRDGTGNHADPGFFQIDPNTGAVALTYLLSGNIGPGILDILNTSGTVSDAISFYNIGANGFMAYYSTAGTDLADSGFVPGSPFHVTEVGNTFAYFSGGVPLANNDYYGVSNAAPDGGSTLALLSGAFALVGAFRRKLRK
jgi:hypothetical protein